MKEYLISYPKKVQYILLTGDTVVVLLAVLCSYTIRILVNQHDISLQLLSDRLSLWLFFVVVSYLVSNYLLDLYNPHRFSPLGSRGYTQIIASVLLANIIVSVCFYFAPKFVYGRQVLLINLALSLVLLCAWRWFIGNKASLHNKTRRLGIVGRPENVLAFAAEIKTISNDGVDVTAVGFVPCLGENELPHSNGNSYVCFNNLSDFLVGGKYDVLLFDSTSTSFSDQDAEEIMELKYCQKSIFDFATYFKNLTGRIPLRYIDGNWLLQKEAIQGSVNRHYIKLKRLLDVALSGILLLLLLPLLFVIGFVIKIDSRGGVLFTQERLGKDRVAFGCYKFLKMVSDGVGQTGPVWAQTGDERITRIGNILRKSRLDELPQLYNILIGDMSFVGPRPIRKYFADKFDKNIPFYDLRFSVHPGLSGWAQVSYGYAATEETQREKFEYELFYIQNMSFILDCVILVKTLKTLFQIQGK